VAITITLFERISTDPHTTRKVSDQPNNTYNKKKKDFVQAAKPDIKKACYNFRVYETKAVTEFNTDLRKEAFKNPVGIKEDRKKHLR
jgi:hypothetical protein